MKYMIRKVDKYKLRFSWATDSFVQNVGREREGEGRSPAPQGQPEIRINAGERPEKLGPQPRSQQPRAWLGFEFLAAMIAFFADFQRHSGYLEPQFSTISALVQNSGYINRGQVAAVRKRASKVRIFCRTPGR
jgi:hypothetical protein